MKEFSDSFRELRKKSGKTLKEVAEKIGVSTTSCSNYEQGKCEPNMVTVCKICDCFNVTVNYLLGIKKR